MLTLTNIPPFFYISFVSPISILSTRIFPKARYFFIRSLPQALHFLPRSFSFPTYHPSKNIYSFFASFPPSPPFFHPLSTDYVFQSSHFGTPKVGAVQCTQCSGLLCFRLRKSDACTALYGIHFNSLHHEERSALFQTIYQLYTVSSLTCTKCKLCRLLTYCTVYRT